MSVAEHIDEATARRFICRATGLGARENLPAMLQRLGYVQLDPLNVCGRMHDLILRNRVGGCTPGGLLDWLHGSALPGIADGVRAARNGFEHYLPGQGILVAWPADAYRFIRTFLDKQSPQRSSRKFTAPEKELAKHILEELHKRGPLTSDEIAHEGRSTTAWGTNGRMAKVVLEKLFWRGSVLITERRGFRRAYDLPARVIPGEWYAPAPTEDELAEWIVRQKLKQRRLVSLTAADAHRLRHEIFPVRIGHGTRAYCLVEDLPLLEQARQGLSSSVEHPVLLAPLDPVIYDRKLTQSIWNFHFRWEVYTPPASRTRGYYSLPVLAGNELVGDVEPRAEWERKRMILLSKRVKRGVSVRPAMAELASFLGLRLPRAAP